MAGKTRKTPTLAHRLVLLAALADPEGCVPESTNVHVLDAIHLAVQVRAVGRAIPWTRP
ncbi:hypothetical protein HUT19_33870 [Streptomyces sp. NA02950]|uniref:hypothetical protein n=1 Tax=Streptomyces sp. NA02950 TaxID=2742137 RepID=UPI00159291E2|nr:hypothetical protein [Streptomyces sp. NA02950]QKV96100.1 hypothetical protein HUT19_33870 [Streptomyces sp. NA02950]